MQINLGQYVNVLQGLCYLNLYIGFQIDFRCLSNLPTGASCGVHSILPIRTYLTQTAKHCKSIAGAQSVLVQQELGFCFIHYCRKRSKRSSDSDVDNKIDNNRDGGNKTRDNTLVKSYAFGNPSLPQRPPRKRKRKPPRTNPRESGK